MQVPQSIFNINFCEINISHIIESTNPQDANSYLIKDINQNSPKFYPNTPKKILPIPNIDLEASNKNQKTESFRKKFSPDEDEWLKKIVSKMGSRRWKEIAKYMPGRSGRQCRDRYQNYLVPGFFYGEWTKEEDELLIKKYEEFGPKWTQMTPYFNNRNANSLKNRWNSFISKRIKKEKNNNNNESNQKYDVCENCINFTPSFNLFDFELISDDEDVVIPN